MDTHAINHAGAVRNVPTRGFLVQYRYNKTKGIYTSRPQAGSHPLHPLDGLYMALIFIRRVGARPTPPGASDDALLVLGMGQVARDEV